MTGGGEEKEKTAGRFSPHRQPGALIFFLSRTKKTKRNDSVHIKATRAGPAVLCTADATYELKTVETTNALLLVPEGEVREERKMAGGEGV